MDNTSTPEHNNSPNPTDTQPVQTTPDPVPDTPSTATESDPAPASPKSPQSSKKKFFLIALIVLVILALIGGAVAFAISRHNSNPDDQDNQPTNQPTDSLPNQLSDFDLSFLKQANTTSNQLYSPLSIKYALGMLEAGADGESKQQIQNVIGSFTPQKYANNQNMSFANAFFVNNALPDGIIKNSYTTSIHDKFNAEVVHIPFTSATPINNWVSDKTFGLITDLIDNTAITSTEQRFVLVNALAIDMEWVNKIQPLVTENKSFPLYVDFPHTDYSAMVEPFDMTGFTRLPFNHSAADVNSLELAAVINKYDILNELGVDNIRQTVIDEYTKWLDTEDATYCAEERGPLDTPEAFIEQYMEELGNGGYQTVESSTDFSLYDDAEVKAFAKDLRTYDGVTLQYVGIMPKTTPLQDYIQNTNANQLNGIISRLKTINFDNFQSGVITEVSAKIPVFKFQDELKLDEALQRIGVTDVFSETRANLSGLTSEPAGTYIQKALHKTTIDFSNDGIKASAATALIGGIGAGGPCFDYRFELPVEKIDLTFDNPYLFLIRDKASGTVWFVGAVYEPTPFDNPAYNS